MTSIDNAVHKMRVDADNAARWIRREKENGMERQKKREEQCRRKEMNEEQQSNLFQEVMKHQCSILRCLLGALLMFQHTSANNPDINGPLFSPQVVRLGEELEITCSFRQLFPAVDDMPTSKVTISKVKPEITPMGTYSSELEFSYTHPKAANSHNQWNPNDYTLTRFPLNKTSNHFRGLKLVAKMECRLYGTYVCSIEYLDLNYSPAARVYYYKDFYVDRVDNTPRLWISSAHEPTPNMYNAKVNITCDLTTSEEIVDLEFVYWKKHVETYYPLLYVPQSKTQTVGKIPGGPCGGFTYQVVTITSDVSLEDEAWTSKIFCIARRPTVEPPENVRSEDLRQDPISNPIEIIQCLFYKKGCGETGSFGTIKARTRTFEKDKETPTQVHYGTVWPVLVLIAMSAVVLIGAVIVNKYAEKTADEQCATL